MIYYMIRHKASGEFMPELKRTRGYSHWNPAKVSTLHNLGSKLLGVPRLFSSRVKAHHSIVQWNAMPNANSKFYGDEEDYTRVKPDGRSKEDLEIVEVNIEVKN